ncbi:hypothetical protein JCM1393_10020 [Clostridium carnis]
MKYLIFIILLVALIAMYFYYDKKLALARKQLMIASKQSNTIKSKYNNTKRVKINFNIKFTNPISKTGILNNATPLYIAPTKNSPVLRKTDIRMEVQILDSAEYDGETWYYVNLPVDTNINSRGWVNKKDFSILYSESSKITKSP